MTNLATAVPAAGRFDVEAARRQFPVLQQQINGHPLVYLDNAATTQKPQTVIDALSDYYRFTNSNVHRGVHELSGRATEAYEGAREITRAFINADSTSEIIFTRGTTEAVNLVANSWVRQHVTAGDEILISGIEHHSNIVPWQMLCEQTGAKLIVVQPNAAGEISLDEFTAAITERTRFVSVVYVSNALGSINPVAGIIEAAHKVDAKVMVDAAQATAHLTVDVQALDADFLAFSGHKVYGPTGIGVLYGKQALLEAMPPWQGGGDMIATVSFSGSTWNELPYKFEAGTPHIAGAIGLGRALQFLNEQGIDAVAAHEHELVTVCSEELQRIDGLRVIGTAAEKASVISFLVEGTHPSDIGTLLDQQGIAIRVGHHCAMPVMEHFGIPGTARASFALYNTHDDSHRFIAAVERAVQMLR